MSDQENVPEGEVAAPDVAVEPAVVETPAVEEPVAEVAEVVEAEGEAQA